MTDVRLAVESDAAAILAVERECREAPHWSDAVWSGVLAAVSGRQCWVGERAGAVVGFVVANRMGDMAELESVAVATDARRQGLGRLLCMAAMDWAHDQGAPEMLLEVRASSEGALDLYRGLGFIEQGRRRGYYRDPTENAVLMAARLGDKAAKV